MENNFSHTISLLRSQRNLSQKQVAASLGISQALLSHYEKGVRECGLDFLVRIADFYGVTADYLLGRTVSLQVSEKDESTSDKPLPLAIRNKRVLVSSIEVVYDLLNRCQNTVLTEQMSDFLIMAIYRVFRSLYASNSTEPDEPFTLSKYMYSALCVASMGLCEAGFDHTAKSSDDNKDITFLSLSTDSLQQTYEKKAATLFKLISRAEQKANISLGSDPK